MNAKEAHFPLNKIETAGSHQNLLSFIHRHDVYTNTLDISSKIRVWTLEPNCQGMDPISVTYKLHDPGC